MIGLGLTLALVSTIAINGGYRLQHREAARLPPLSARRPLWSLGLLLRTRVWLVGFVAGIGGWVLYVVALAFAPLSLVQATSAAGMAVLAIGVERLATSERIGVACALAGLALLGLSLGSHTSSNAGHATAIALWLGASALAALIVTSAWRRGAGLGTSAGVLYAGGDVATKAAVTGGARLAFVPAVLGFHGLAFVALQLAFQRAGRLATAGLAVLWTNALPIVAGTLLFGEGLPEGWPGTARVAGFVLVLASAVALSRQQPAPAEPSAVPI